MWYSERRFRGKQLIWSKAKNKLLMQTRDISFEDVAQSLNEKALLDIINPPDGKKYFGQKIFVLEIKNYAYMVPYVEEQDYIFLKTIFPSRKASKLYLRSYRGKKS